MIKRMKRQTPAQKKVDECEHDAIYVVIAESDGHAIGAAAVCASCAGISVMENDKMSAFVAQADEANATKWSNASARIVLGPTSDKEFAATTLRDATIEVSALWRSAFCHR